MLNVLSVDVEDYFQVEAFVSQIRYDQWSSFQSRVERNVVRILELFDGYQVKGTFFILGWIAERFPRLIRSIGDAGHEIACHGYAHRRLHHLTPDQFRADLRRATALLTDEVQRPLYSYRAPSFSIVSGTTWAFDILADEGYCFDSSIFPVRHDVYGIPDANRFPHWRHSRSGGIFEFPPSTVRIAEDRNLGVGGGGYLRLTPYGLTYWALRHINAVEQQPAMVYFHPWEIDPGQPAIRAGLRSTIRHYTNLATMEAKIERLLQDFSFTSLADACTQHQAYLSPQAPHSLPALVGRQSVIPVRVRAAGAGT
jgi:polysaccharide deacetylase family protein (PEP-CTERM system associated)